MSVERIAELEARLADAERRFSEASSAWIPLADSRRPDEGSHVWIAGYGPGGRFYSEAVFKRGEWLMFDQEESRYFWPCEFPTYWRPIDPIPEAP